MSEAEPIKYPIRRLMSELSDPELRQKMAPRQATTLDALAGYAKGQKPKHKSPQ